MFGQFSYLVYMLVFTIIPMAIVWSINWRRLSANLRVILLVGLTGVVYQLTFDPFAESWQAWFFSEDKILGLWLFNFPLENVLFFLLVPIAISSVVLTLIDFGKTKKLAKSFRKF